MLIYGPALKAAADETFMILPYPCSIIGFRKQCVICIRAVILS
jgi:hypothetical protein